MAVSDYVVTTYASSVSHTAEAAMSRCGSRRGVVHLSDTGRTIYRHDPIGDGTIDFRAVIEALAAIGWSDPLVLEIVAAGSDIAARFAESTRLLDALGAADLPGAARTADLERSGPSAITRAT